ncbi:MAG: DUF6029 family protein [bacterium]
MRKIIYLNLFLVLLFSGIGQSFDIEQYNVTISGNNYLLYLLEKDSGKQYYNDRFEASLYWGPFELGTVINMDFPRYIRYEGTPEKRKELGQIYLSFYTERVSARAGTLLHSMGRGLLVRSYEDRDLDLLRYLTGASVSIRPISFLEFTGLGGVGKWNENDQYEDTVYGGEVNVYPLQTTELPVQPFVDFGISHIRIPTTLGEDFYYDHRFILFGGGSSFPYGSGEFYFAKRKPMRTAFDFEEKIGGEARYLSINGFIPKVASIQFEYKFYDKYAGPFYANFITPPNLTIFGSSLNEGGNEKGFLFSVSSQPVTGLHLHLAYDKANEIEHPNPEIPELYLEEFQFDVLLQEVIPKVDPGFYIEYQSEYEDSFFKVRPIGTFFITNEHSVAGSFEYEKRHEKLWEGAPKFKDEILELTYYWTGRVSTTWMFEHTNQLRDEMGNPTRNKLNFIEVKYYINPTSNIAVGYGQIRGGKVCAGGICRIENPFMGFRIKLTAVF